MTTDDWINATDPQSMLLFLRNSGKATDRKLRLFAVACCRRIWHLLTDKRSRKVVEASERYADGLATRKQLERAWDGADDAMQSIHLSGGGDVDQNPSQAVVALGIELEVAEAAELAAATFGAVARGDAYDQIWKTPGKASEERWSEDDAVREAAETAEVLFHAALLRDIFGPLPFRPVTLPPSVRTRNDGTIPKLAEAAYQERALPSGELDRERLAVLADALEEVGADDLLLGHLRGPGPRVRGDWLIDMLTGRE